MPLRKLLIACLLLISLPPSMAQLRELRFNRLTVEDGLPENTATCHLQDKYGYHWFGTQNGLVRYDGYKVKLYNLETTTGYTPAYRSIWSLVEDKDGYIWGSTSSEGIFRFDRTTEKCVSFKLPPGVSDKGQLFRMLIDKEGMIWGAMRTPGGKWHLDRLDPKTGKFTIYDSVASLGNAVASGNFNWSLVTKDGGFWVSGNHGLHRYDYATKKFKTLINSDVRYFYEAPSEPGILWVIQKEGKKFILSRYNIKTGVAEVFRHDPANVTSIHSDTASIIFETASKDLWISTGNGISLFNRTTKTFKPYIPSNPFPEDSLSNTCYDIWEGKKGELWIRTLRRGLLYLSSPAGAVQRYVYDESRPDGLPRNTVSSNSFIDRQGNFWAVIAGIGICKLDEKASQFTYVQKYNEESKYKGGDLSAIAPLDADHALVLGIKGLFNYNKKDSQYTPIDIPVAKEKKILLTDVIIDHSGIAWLCSAQGLFSYDPRSGKSKQYVNDPADSTSLANNNVRNVYDDRNGNLWVGTYGGGLNKLDKATGKFTRYPFSIDQTGLEKGVLDDDQVIHMYEDRKGILWVGTNNGGLNRMDAATGKFKSFFERGSGFQCITFMYEDSKNRFWVGTYLWGLFLFDKETGKVIRRFTEKDGLAYDQISGIKEDQEGRIWVSSERGFSILNGKDFSISYLNTSNGLPNNHNSALYIYALDDDWVIGTRGGFIRFQPGELIRNTTPPKVLIQSIAFNRAKADSTILLSDQTKLSFDHDQNRLLFRFVGLHYTNPALNQYQYKLEGYDKDWVKAGTQREALYTNLSPGTYTFFVKASNSDGVWSDPVSIEITVLPPWWKTWWAYVSYVLMFGFAVWKYIDYYKKKIQRENLVLEEKVQHRTAQLQNTIETLKTTQVQLVQAEKMASLGELTAGIAHEIQNPLNFINNFAEVTKELSAELKEELNNKNVDAAKGIADDITNNAEKIVHHGKRADSIVKNMLQHSRKSSGQKEPTDINALADEYLRLSYHGLRAKDKTFNANFKTSFDENLGTVNVMSQDVGRVFLNLFNNAFYAVSEKRRQFDSSYQPMIEVSTKRDGDKVVVHVKDNGTGIPDKVLNKIYQPFFTTKPTGEGTGLGLSMSYDIITKGHGGELKVETKEGEGTEFIITLNK